MVIKPTLLNILIIGFSVIVFGFLWRMTAAKFADTPWGRAMAVTY